MAEGKEADGQDSIFGLIGRSVLRPGETVVAYNLPYDEHYR